jgi:hypothetical protein
MIRFIGMPIRFLIAILFCVSLLPVYVIINDIDEVKEMLHILGVFVWNGVDGLC